MIPDGLRSIVRPSEPVTLPGGSIVRVRSLTVAELLKVDAYAEAAAENGRGVLFVCLRAACAVCDDSGAPHFPNALRTAEAAAEASADAAEVFTVHQLETINAAAAPAVSEQKKS